MPNWIPFGEPFIIYCPEFIVYPKKLRKYLYERMNKGEILQEVSLIKDVLKVSFNYFIYLVNVLS